MARPEITARISADGSGFRRELTSIRGFAKSWAGNIRSYFISAFSVAAITRMTKSVIDHVREIDKIAESLKLSTDEAQQLKQYTDLVGESIDKASESAESLQRALDMARSMEIKPLLTKDDLSAVRQLEAGLRGISDWWKRGAAGGLNAMRNIVESIMTGRETARMERVYNYRRNERKGAVIPGLMAPYETQEDRFPTQEAWRKAVLETGVKYAYEEAISQVRQADWINKINEELSKGGTLRNLPVKKESPFAPPTDALARIGGFVGQGTQNRVQHHLQQMNRHLATIERALVSRGIKIQDL